MIFVLTLIKTFRERDKRLAGANKLLELIFRDGKPTPHFKVFDDVDRALGAIYFA